MTTRYRTIDIAGIDIFYREAGDPAHPTIVLLHGFPSASHMFRDLIPELEDDYHVIAPDLPGFGQSGQPPRDQFSYTFDALAESIVRFIDALGIANYALYVFDYGAPIGFRLALQAPERVTAIVSQNGNCYSEGVSPALDPIAAYWADESAENRNALRGLLTPETTLFQYTHGVADPERVSPDGRNLDDFYLARPGNDEIQLDLFLDYRTNVALYPDIQAYFRQYRPPLLAIWGKNDPFFVPAGAEAFRRDLPDAEIRFVESGHFALETHAADIGQAMRDFLGRVIAP